MFKQKSSMFKQKCGMFKQKGSAVGGKWEGEMGGGGDRSEERRVGKEC